MLNILYGKGSNNNDVGLLQTALIKLVQILLSHDLSCLKVKNTV